MADPRFKTGARLSPRYKLLAARPYRAAGKAPAQFAIIPKQLDMWGNDQYGDCVPAEEAFKCACDNPEDFIPAATVISWAQQHGFLDGADLSEVLDAMLKGGFVVGQNTYDDGPKSGVDYSQESVLQSAIAQGPVKIAIDSSALPSGAGNKQGWSAFGGSPGQYGNTDHCVALCGYGPTTWLCQQLGVPVPSSGFPASAYLLYTWSTIGLVDHAWIMSTCQEAWLRNPSTIIVGPEPQPLPPGPTPTPTPPVPPSPGPSPAPSPSLWSEIIALILQYGPAILSFLLSLLQAAQREIHRHQHGSAERRSGS